MSGSVGDTVDFAEIHDELRAVARDVLARDAAGPTPGGLADLGWPGLEVPDEFGGAGASFAETAIVLEEFGRAAGRGLFGIALGAGTCSRLAETPARDDLLRALASGETATAVALVAAPGDCGVTPPPFHLRTGRGGLVLSGRAEFVPDATTADRIVLLAADPEDVPVIVAVEANALVCTAQTVLDETRAFASVTADDVVVHDDSAWRFAADPADAVSHLRDRAALSIACDSLGLATAMLDATTAYVGVREQFGRPVGSFQAVKHACADMLVRTTVARQLVSDAVRRMAEGDPDTWAATSMAKSYTCAAAVEITGKAMQLHGGIGYTWESGIHRYHKRAMLNRALFGSPAAHRRRLAGRYTW